MTTEVYIALGGNIRDTLSIFTAALNLIAAIPQISNLTVSQFYRNRPVSDIPQADYLNAVCRFQTTFSAKGLLYQLQTIEKTLGKRPKAKNEPRILDIDILFFGLEQHNLPELEIPHPRWQERLFVLMPLSDLISNITIPSPLGNVIMNIPNMISQFTNWHFEIVSSNN